MSLSCRLRVIFCCALAATAQEVPLSERVLVVYNANGQDSLRVAKYYLEQRKIPERNLCKIAVSSPDAVRRDEYEARVKAPIRKCLQALGKQRILYIVFSFRTPFVVLDQNAGYALDSAVADIWDEYSLSQVGRDVPAHSYLGEAQSQGNVYAPYVPLAKYREHPKASTIYSVWRVDAATAEIAQSLVYKAMHAETHGLTGKGCFDLQFGKPGTLSDYGSGAGDWDVHQAAEFARRAGFEVVEDEQRTEFGTAPSPLRCEGAVLYAGWYSLQNYNDAFSWYPGAIGFHLDSGSATHPREGGSWSAKAIMKGITVTSGAVAEPFLEGLPHPDQVFLYLFQGANVGDAFLRSTRWLKWRIINIGDPLYRPFPKGITRAAGAAALDGFLALLPQTLIAGDPASALVGLRLPAKGTQVSLKTDRADVITLPATVTIPENAKSTGVTITTRPVRDDVVVLRITMTAGEVSRSNTLVLLPLLSSVSLSAPKVQRGASVTGTVTLNRQAGTGGVTIKLVSSNPGAATTPEQVTVPAGASSATFTVTTSAAGAATSITIKASLAGREPSAALAIEP